MKYIFILGNTPQLSTLEIQACLPATEIILATEQILIVNTPKAMDTEKLMAQLGGTIKIGLLLGESELDNYHAWQNWMPSILNNFQFKNDKIKFGFSIYNLNNQFSNKQLKKIQINFKKNGLSYKKQLKENDLRSELIECRDFALSSVIINKEKCLDILTIIDQDKIYYGYTIAYQDYKKFSQRDYGRPNRDAKSGMLPPKVARMMVNIAGGNKAQSFLDAFCGSGTILQEALLLGYEKVIGSDISEKAIFDTQKNLEYLKLNNFKLFPADAKNINEFITPNSISTAVSEVYLGPTQLDPQKIPYIADDLAKLYQEVFATFKKILKPGANLVIAFPAWKLDEKITHLPMQKILQELGYKEKNEPIIYGRPDAKVLREIYFIKCPQ